MAGEKQPSSSLSPPFFLQLFSDAKTRVKETNVLSSLEQAGMEREDEKFLSFSLSPLPFPERWHMGRRNYRTTPPLFLYDFFLGGGYGSAMVAELIGRRWVSLLFLSSLFFGDIFFSSSFPDPFFWFSFTPFPQTRICTEE